MPVDYVKTCAPYAVGSAADFASTRLAHGTEANPLQRTLGAQIAAQTASAAIGCWGDAKLQRRGHKRAASVLRVAVLALKLGLTARNLSR